MQKKYIDLSHTIEHGVKGYKNLPAPIICDFLSRKDSEPNYEPGTSFQIGKIEMVGNTGTYIDCPFHRYEDGKDLSEVALKKFVDLEAMVFDAPWQNGIAIGADFFRGKNIKGKAILIHTGWSEFFANEKYYDDHPFLTEEGAEYLKKQEVVLVGIDSHNLDDTRSNRRPAHSILLKEEILIVEHLTHLDQVPKNDFLFSAVPPKIKSFGTFPVRAFATINKIGKV